MNAIQISKKTIINIEKYRFYFLDLSDMILVWYRTMDRFAEINKNTELVIMALLNRNVEMIQPSASIQLAAKAKQMRAEGKDVISLAGGEPDFATPAPIVEEAYRQLRSGFTHYTLGQGLPELRERIVRKLQEENAIQARADDIIVTPGGKIAIYLALQAMINPGDEIMYLEPAWVSYVSMIRANGGVPVPVRLSEENDYCITAEALEERVSEHTKLLIVNYPNNPTGKLLSAEEAEVIAGFLGKHKDLLLLSDEVYERIVFDGLDSVSPASIPGLSGRVITVNSFSKSLAMTGWRIGYLVAPSEITKPVYKLCQHSFTCVAGFIQRAAAVGLDCADEIEAMRNAYQCRRDQFIAALNGIEGVKARIPQGAFYAWVKFTKGGLDDFAMCDYLLREALVAGVPGECYGSEEKHCIRFSFAEDLRKLMDAAERIRRALEKL